MSLFVQTRTSGFMRAAQVMALGASLATASAPTRASDDPNLNSVRLPARPLTEPVHTPKSSDEIITHPTAVSPVQRAETVAQEPYHFRWRETLAVACTIGAAGWYYRQIKKRETAASLTSLSLQAVNDILLTFSAVLTGQGVGAASVTAIFAGIGILGIREVLRQRADIRYPLNNENKFTKMDMACTVCCIAGWSAVIACSVPSFAQRFGAGNLSLVASLVGTAAFGISCIPLFKLFSSGRQIAPLQPSFWNRMRPAMPFALGAAALGLGLSTVPQAAFCSVAQPVGLLLINAALAVSAIRWGFTRYTANSSARSPIG